MNQIISSTDWKKYYPNRSMPLSILYKFITHYSCWILAIYQDTVKYPSRSSHNISKSSGFYVKVLSFNVKYKQCRKYYTNNAVQCPSRNRRIMWKYDSFIKYYQIVIDNTIQPMYQCLIHCTSSNRHIIWNMNHVWNNIKYYPMKVNCIGMQYSVR